MKPMNDDLFFLFSSLFPPRPSPTTITPECFDCSQKIHHIVSPTNKIHEFTFLTSSANTPPLSSLPARSQAQQPPRQEAQDRRVLGVPLRGCPPRRPREEVRAHGPITKKRFPPPPTPRGSAADVRVLSSIAVEEFFFFSFLFCGQKFNMKDEGGVGLAQSWQLLLEPPFNRLIHTWNGGKNERVAHRTAPHRAAQVCQGDMGGPSRHRTRLTNLLLLHHHTHTHPLPGYTF